MKQFMSPLRKPLVLRTAPNSAFTLTGMHVKIEQGVNHIYSKVVK